MIIKAFITYDDNSEALFVGEPVDLSAIPTDSPNPVVAEEVRPEAPGETA